jgi:GTP cyclohydrolase I
VEEQLTPAAATPIERASTENAHPVDLPAAARAIEAFLSALGHPPHADPELRETGMLVARAFHEELLSGHRADPAAILRETLAATASDLIVVRDLPVTCICPHHLLPASGVLHLGYLPGARIVGFGALSRLALAYARRLILQETLCERVAEALCAHLGARGAGCIAELQPQCLCARGDRPAQATVVTAATSGELRHDPERRREFFMLAGATRKEARP